MPPSRKFYSLLIISVVKMIEKDDSFEKATNWLFFE